MEKASIWPLDAKSEVIAEEKTNEALPWTETNGWTSFSASCQDLCFSWVDFSCFWGRTEPLQSTKSINVCMFWNLTPRSARYWWPTSTSKMAHFKSDSQASEVCHWNSGSRQKGTSSSFCQTASIIWFVHQVTRPLFWQNALVIGDQHLRAMVDKFVAMPEGPLSYSFLAFDKATASEIRAELFHTDIPLTPDVVCVLATSNGLLCRNKDLTDVAKEFAGLLFYVRKRWEKV